MGETTTATSASKDSFPRFSTTPPDPSVENGAARHTHDTSFVQVASGNALVCALDMR